MLLTPELLAGKIDQTLLKPYVTEAELREHCEQAMRYHFKTVAINNAPVPFCHEILKGSGVLCDAAVSFPLGQCTIETKVFEALDVIEKGAGEVDYVINLVAVKSGRWDYVEQEMLRIVQACHSKNTPCKSIFENCYLNEAEKRKLCAIALRAGPDYIKTSTGFGTGGAVPEDVSLMRQCVGDRLRIKAAGGVRTAEQALAMLRAGADRIGTSQGPAIVDGYRAMLQSGMEQPAL